MNIDIIGLAQEAGLHVFGGDVIDALERFAALVAAAEREECAKMIEEMFDFCGDEILAADTIRARGSEK